MDANRPKYVSVYRIDGVPILPPLMTPEKRRQMLMFKELAIQLENSKKKQKLLKQTGQQLQSCNLLRYGHSHIPQPNTSPRTQLSETSSSGTTTKREQLEKLRKTETIVYDNKANSIILTLEGFEEETDFQSMVLERPKSKLHDQKFDQNDNKISPDVSKTSLSPTKDELSSPHQVPAKPQPYAAFIPIPSICVNPPTPSVQNNPICSLSTTPSKRLCNSPTLKADLEPHLIRSNSFTLDGPSNALIQHFRNQKLKKSTATQDTIESKAKRVQKVEAKPKVKSPSSPSLNHFSNNVIFRAKRSPYEIKQTSKTKLARKHKTVKPITTATSPLSSKKSKPVEVFSAIEMTPPQSTSNLDLLKDIEEQHRARFNELVRLQQIEQKRLQKDFEMQQKLLLEQLSARVARVQILAPSTTVSPPTASSSTLIGDSVQSSPSISPEQESSSSARVTPPRRRLFLENFKEPATVARDASPSPQNSSRRVSFE